MKQLETLSIVAPGFFGLNTQESGVTLSPNYAQLTDNVVIDKYGRLGSRKGWLMKTIDGATELNGNPIRFMMENLNADNTTTLLSAGNNKIFKNGNGSALVDITPNLYTITDNDWSGATLLEKSVLAQEGHEPLVYDFSATPNLQTMTDYTGSVQNYGVNFPRYVISAYGRIWGHNGSTVYWSTDIADTTFPCFCGGTSGSLNIAAVLPRNVDEIVSLAVHNDFLIIFCRHNIVIYGGARNPIGVNFALADIISGVGCVAKNSVQNTGNDLIFLSDTGVRSLGRLLQEKSLPMRDLTKNIRDDFIKDMNTEIENYGSLDHVASVYSEVNAFYLISFPSSETVYMLDMRQPLEDGSARCTVWFQYPAHSFLRLNDRSLLIGKDNGIGEYAGYTDNGSPYRIRYFSHYLDLGSSTTNKMLKQVKVTILGGSNQQFTIKVGTDYDASYLSYPFVIDTGVVYEYGIAKYPEYLEFKGTVANFAALPLSPSVSDAYMTLDDNSVYQWNGASWVDKTLTWEDEFTLVSSSAYSGSVVIDTIKSSVGSSGNVIQIGFEADVNGSELSVQTLDCFVKTGRIS